MGSRGPQLYMKHFGRKEEIPFLFLAVSVSGAQGTPVLVSPPLTSSVEVPSRPLIPQSWVRRSRDLQDVLSRVLSAPPHLGCSVHWPDVYWEQLTCQEHPSILGAWSRISCNPAGSAAPVEALRPEARHAQGRPHQPLQGVSATGPAPAPVSKGRLSTKCLVSLWSGLSR